MGMKLTQEEFINRCVSIYGTSLDFSKLVYKRNRIKIVATCVKHGDFEIYPFALLGSQGCKYCSGARLSNIDFIERANKAHNFKYDYSKLNFISLNHKVNIICPHHGEFIQRAQSHLKGLGCRLCSFNRPLNTEIFIEEAKKLHQNKYNYDKVKYVDSKTKVILICKEHGEFLQLPSNHLKKYEGCSGCVRYQTEERCRKLLNKIFNTNFKKCKPEWLINPKTNGRLELDGYASELCIAFEYNGKQHYDLTFFSKTVKHLKKIQQRDLLKKQICDKYGVKLIVISEAENLKECELEDKIKNILKNNNISNN